MNNSNNSNNNNDNNNNSINTSATNINTNNTNNTNKNSETKNDIIEVNGVHENTSLNHEEEINHDDLQKENIENFKRAYEIYNAFQTNPELMSAALTVESHVASTSSNNENINSNESFPSQLAMLNAFIQQNQYFIQWLNQSKQLNEAYQASLNTERTQESSSKSTIDCIDLTTSNNERNDPNNSQNIAMNGENGEPLNHGSKSKMRRHHHHHHHNSSHKKPDPLESQSNSSKIMKCESLNLNTSISSSFTESTSSSSSSPSSSTSPSLLYQSTFPNSAPQSPKITNESSKQQGAFDVNHHRHHLHHNHHHHSPKKLQSLSVPKLISSPVNCTNVKKNTYNPMLNYQQQFQNQQQSFLNPTTSNTLAMPSSSSTPSSTNKVSNEVKQKLKETILKKQLNGLGSNANINSSFSNNQGFNLTMPTSSNNDSLCSQFDSDVSQLYKNVTNQLIDENSLRRTTSEPNLKKVKSALKDRLLGKRVHINPFPIKRPINISPIAIANNNNNSNNNQLMANFNNTFNNFHQSLNQINNTNNNFLASTSLPKLPLNLMNPTALAIGSLTSEQEQHDQILAAAAATVAALANGNQNSLLQHLNLHHQHQQHQQNNPYFATFLNQQQLNDLKLTSSFSFPNLPSTSTKHVNSMLNSTKLRIPGQTQNLMPKFGHMAHVEEENELYLENEIKDAAKINDVNTKHLLYDSSQGSTSVLNSSQIKNSSNSQLNLNINNRTSTRNVNNIKNTTDAQYCHNSLDEAQKQLFMLQQELECKQQHYQHNSKISLSLSNPYLLSSLEISGPKKNMHFANSHNSNAHSNVTQMECTTSKYDEKQYRYTTGIAYDKTLLKHECLCKNSANHLETPDRIKAVWAHFKSRDLDEECEIITSKQASVSDLLTCHSEQYAQIYGSDPETRLKLPAEYIHYYMMSICRARCGGMALANDPDNAWNEEHTSIVCRTAIGCTYELADLVYKGKLRNGFALVRPPGSHAEYNKPLGFCYFNTVAIVAKMLKKNLGLDRILIVDWDVHHGNGTQQVTYNDPNILYISLHRHDNGNFFPGTGAVNECGQDAGLGMNVNIAWNSKLNPPMTDVEYLAAFRSVVMPIAKSFKPQIVLVSCGFDATESHPKELGGFKLTPTCFAYMTRKLMSLAEGKVILVLEGGYDKQSLCDCSEMCMNALMNKQLPSFPKQTLESLPHSSAIQDLENVADIQKKYWPIIKEYKRVIKLSQNDFISIGSE